MTDVALEIQVRYHEVDRMGIVYHPRYYSWFEMARMELLRQLGQPYDRLEDQGVALPITRCEAEYLRPLVFGQWFRLECVLESLEGARFRLGYRVLVDDEVHARGTTEHAALRLDSRKATRLPAALVEAFARLPSQGGDHPVIEARDPVEGRLEQAEP